MTEDKKNFWTGVLVIGLFIAALVLFGWKRILLSFVWLTLFLFCFGQFIDQDTVLPKTLFAGCSFGTFLALVMSVLGITWNLLFQLRFSLKAAMIFGFIYFLKIMLFGVRAKTE